MEFSQVRAVLNLSALGLPGSRILLTIGLLAGAGCSSLFQVAEYPFKQIETIIDEETGEEKPRLTPVELENQLMRFADNASGGMVAAVGELKEHGRPLDPAQQLHLKLGFSEDIYQIATGPNPYANLLDMITLTSLLRVQLASWWMPRRWGSSAQPLLDVMRRNETAIWDLGKDVLKPKMQNELRVSIHRWALANGQMNSFSELRATGFATAIAKYVKSTDQSSGQSVFDLLQIDPLASLDPTTKEIARSRRMAERALFLAQRTPTLLSWQTELLTLAITRNPELDRAIDATAKISEAADTLSRVAAQLPADLARERQAILQAVQAETGPLTGMVSQARGALEAGHAMAASTDGTIKTLADFYATLNKGPKDPHAKPFNIDDYKDLAEDIATTSIQLNHLLGSVEHITETSGSVIGHEKGEILALADQIEARGDRLIQKLLYAGLTLIVGACLGIFATLVLYRAVVFMLPNRDRS